MSGVVDDGVRIEIYKQGSQPSTIDLNLSLDDQRSLTIGPSGVANLTRGIGENVQRPTKKLLET